MKKSRLRERGSYIFRALRLVWDTTSQWTVLWATSQLLRGLIPAGTVYLTKVVVDSVAAAVGSGATWETVESVLWPVLAMGGLLVLQQGLQQLSGWVQTAQSELLQDHIKQLIHEKAVQVDYQFYESSEYFDKLQQANSQASSRTLSLLQNVGSIAQHTITFISIGVILATYSIWLPFLLVVGMLPALLVVLRYNRKYHDWWKSVTEQRRRAWYYDWLVTDQTSAAEMRMFDLGPQVSRRYRDVRKALREQRIRLSGEQALAQVGAALQAILVMAGVMGWMVWRAFRGLATLGDLALFYQAINQGQTLVRSMMNNVGQIYASTLFIEHLFDFLELETEMKQPSDPVAFPPRLKEGIRFDEVTFSYPGSEEAALQEFSLHIPAGATVAIVGANGAGKSTVTKLLCRLYDPQQGSITLDGIDVRELSTEELWRQIAIMFQFPVRYQATAFENITLDADYPYPSAVREAAVAAGAHEFIEQMPRGYDTQLGRFFEGGTELSGGEWQRIALARVYLRQAPIVILDEPTSHMDSWAENEWLQRFRQIVDTRTALVITHRFTTAKQADIIHVMDEGRIVESGTHTDLVMRGGAYARSWVQQTRRTTSGSVDTLVEGLA